MFDAVGLPHNDERPLANRWGMWAYKALLAIGEVVRPLRATAELARAPALAAQQQARFGPAVARRTARTAAAGPDTPAAADAAPTGQQREGGAVHRGAPARRGGADRRRGGAASAPRRGPARGARLAAIVESSGDEERADSDFAVSEEES